MEGFVNGPSGPKARPGSGRSTLETPFLLAMWRPLPAPKKRVVHVAGCFYLQMGWKALGFIWVKLGRAFSACAQPGPLTPLWTINVILMEKKIILLNFIWIFSSSISSHWINRVPVGARRPSFPKEGWNLIFFLFLIFFSLIRIN